MQAIFERFAPSAGLRTELFFAHDAGAVYVDGDALVVRTPDNPTFYFGNMLLFEHGPQAGDDVRWPAHFDAVFGDDQRVRHAAFCWTGSHDVSGVAPFRQRGYAFDERTVLTAQRPAAFEPPAGFTIRTLCGDRDWSAQLQLEMDSRPEIFPEAAFLAFMSQVLIACRSLAQRGAGAWLGAFDGEHLAGSCGIFDTGYRLARYRSVVVSERYRNRGIARALLSAAAERARERYGAETLAIVADANGFARRLYERLGFTPVAHECELWKADRTA